MENEDTKFDSAGYTILGTSIAAPQNFKAYSSEISRQSTKTYTPEQGLSCCFRQWRADSHCNLLHGYALGFRFTFEASNLDARGWVADFGDLSELKDALKYYFDHTTAVAKDDPNLPLFQQMRQSSLIDLRIFDDGVGCERFAEFAWKKAAEIVAEKYGDRVQVISCECREHAGNSAIYNHKMVPYHNTNLI